MKQQDKHFDDSDDDSSVAEEMSQSSSSQTGSDYTGKESKEEQRDRELRDQIIKREERAVRNARFVVLIAILAAAVAVSAAIYVFARKADQTSFEIEVGAGGSSRLSLGDTHRIF